MRLYLAGGVSGNLKPAWTNMAKSDISDNGFKKALIDENFWRGGESRHWLQDATSPIKENENISGEYNEDGGGVIKSLFPPDMFDDENISCKPTYISEIPRGGQLAELAIGGIFDDADISCGQYDIPTIHRSDIIRGGL